MHVSAQFILRILRDQTQWRSFIAPECRRQACDMAGLAATFRLLYSAETSFERCGCRWFKSACLSPTCLFRRRCRLEQQDPLCKCPCVSRSKLQAAENILEALLDGTDEAGASATAGLPALVCAHYLRSLLEWSCGAVTKKGGEAAAADGKKEKKRKQQAGAGTGESPGDTAAAGPPAPRLQPRCWAVLVSVLGSSATPVSQPLPAALLPAATAALQALQPGGLAALAAAEAAALLAQLAALFALLVSKFAGSFRPSLEHAVAAAEAALSGHAAAACSNAPSSGACRAAAQAWEAVATGAVRLLLAAAVGHPNQRKVWDAAVPRLLPLLAGAGFAGDGAVSEGADSAKLGALCRQALDAVLFHPQHVPPLAAAAAAHMAAAIAEEQAAAAGGTAVEAVVAEDGRAAAQQAGSVPPGYAAQLFATLQRQLAERQLPLGLLPWMAGRFCAALRQHRRAAEAGGARHGWGSPGATPTALQAPGKGAPSRFDTRCACPLTEVRSALLHAEAAIAGQAGRRSQQESHGGEDTRGEGLPEAGGTVPRPAGTHDRLSVSADFHFWLALLRTLLPHVQRLQSQEPRDDVGTELAEAVG